MLLIIFGVIVFAFYLAYRAEQKEKARIMEAECVSREQLIEHMNSINRDSRYYRPHTTNKMFAKECKRSKVMDDIYESVPAAIMPSFDYTPPTDYSSNDSSSSYSSDYSSSDYSGGGGDFSGGGASGSWSND